MKPPAAEIWGRSKNTSWPGQSGQAFLDHQIPASQPVVKPSTQAALIGMQIKTVSVPRLNLMHSKLDVYGRSLDWAYE